jgi:spermidine synthase
MLDMEFIDQTRERMERHLGRTSAFKFTMPCYHCGEYVFVVASKSVNPSGPDIDRLTELQTERNLATKYWSPEIHHASQVFPLTLG